MSNNGTSTMNDAQFREHIKELAFKYLKENMEWLFEGIGNNLDYEPPEVDNDMPLEDVPLHIDGEDRPFNAMLAKCRLAGESVYEVDMHEVEQLLLKKGSEGAELLDESYTQGKLVVAGELLEALGYSHEGALAKAWGYWAPYN